MQTIPRFHNKYSNPDTFFPDFGQLTDKALGCRFEAKDQPGIKGKKGDQLGLQLEFRWQLIDTCNNNQILDHESWNVFGSGKVP